MKLSFQRIPQYIHTFIPFNLHLQQNTDLHKKIINRIGQN